MPVAQDWEYGPLSSLTVTSPPGVKDGASFTALTVMVNVWLADVSESSFAVPPLSCRLMVIVALPNAFAAGVKLSTPDEEIVGPEAKSEGLLFDVTLNVSVCPVSSGGPALIAVAHAALYEPESSLTVTFPPPVKD